MQLETKEPFKKCQKLIKRKKKRRPTPASAILQMMKISKKINKGLRRLMIAMRVISDSKKSK